MKVCQKCVLMLFCIAGTIVNSGATASPAQQPSTMQNADELFSQSKWADAAAAYTAIAAIEPANGAAWQNLGESFLQQHKDKEAAEAFERAISIPYRPLLNHLNLARVYADARNREKTIAQLQLLADSGQGGRLRPLLLSSSEFAPLKGDTEFQKLLEKMAPCRSAEYHEFDFWVGNWDVRAPNGGASVGHNVVTSEQEGCLVVEHWTALTGGQTGTSFNYYDVRDKKWHQLYLDNSGNAGAFPAMAGDLVGGRMVLVSDESQSPVSRWTWYVVEPGKVRQMAEQSTDGEKTWNITWDSVYVKQN
jgi:tetratricopeptide (TPR) repeat protein